MVCDFFYPSAGGVENHVHQVRDGSNSGSCLPCMLTDCEHAAPRFRRSWHSASCGRATR